ncbi:PRC-barrel domain-containing protein [Thioalkalicoccus limnaeus]|uniref:PRC-barrel domain-containing protein n=1 Tax=Thioalkalicoccus limnaeus TaxID=120681 RepID=A0ABV4BEE9_9GAMM
MRKLTSLALALLVPAFAFGLGSVSAAETDRSSKSDTAFETYQSGKPADAFYADDVIGSNLKSRVGDKDIGSINDLIMDKDGRVVAAIVDVGGFLGMGQKSVALDWQSVEATVDEDGNHVFHVNATEDTLKNTPEHKRD